MIDIQGEDKMDKFIGKKVIAEIEFTETLEELHIKTDLKKWGKCDIVVWGNEGTIPHFHIKSKTTGKEACVCIFEPKYFNHESNHTTLGNKEKKELNEFLKSKSDKSKTVWEEIRDSWDDNNGDKVYEHKDELTKMKQPDYSKMTEDRHK